MTKESDRKYIKMSIFYLDTYQSAAMHRDGLCHCWWPTKMNKIHNSLGNIFMLSRIHHISSLYPHCVGHRLRRRRRRRICVCEWVCVCVCVCARACARARARVRAWVRGVCVWLHVRRPIVLVLYLLSWYRDTIMIFELDERCSVSYILLISTFYFYTWYRKTISANTLNKLEENYKM